MPRSRPRRGEKGWPGGARMVPAAARSEEHTPELPYHRDLLSFPTRRSSDLCAAERGDARRVCRAAGRDVAKRVGRVGRGWCPQPPDRKSTRLNSRTTEIYSLSLHDALPIYARQKGVTPDAYAAQQAETWRKGLAGWGEDGARIR